MWFFSSNESQFRFTVTGNAPAFEVYQFSGIEQIGENYHIQIEVVCASENVDLIALQHQSACLTIQHATQPRYIHGIVLESAHLKTDARHNYYRFTIAPQAELLKYRTNQRIFQNKTVTEIIQDVWAKAGFNPAGIRIQIQTTLPSLTYCVQYQETDLHFIQRLCETHGLFYYFEHSAAQHVMVFADNIKQCPKTESAKFQPSSGNNADESTFEELDWQYQVTAGKASVQEHDFTKPSFNLSATQQTGLREWYEYATGHQTQSDAQTQATRQLQQQQYQQQRLSGTGNIRHAYPGCFLPIIDHPTNAINTEWLVLSVKHQGKQPQVLKELVSGSSQYKSQIILHAKNQILSLPPVHFKPQPAGFQTAIVTGPEGEEIHTDEYGRIKVQFHWDKAAKGDDTTSCWVRVAQGWAGAGYGQFFLPRAGQEVVIAFAEHDIDRPYVVGTVHNATNTAPIKHPTSQTQSGFRTLSSPGGQGFNELRFEDKKGAEQIVLHAQRNWYRKVKRTSRTEIGSNEHLWVGGEDKRLIKKNEHQTINKNRLIEIAGNQDLHVLQNKHVHIDAKWLTKNDQELHINAGQVLVLEGSSGLSLDAGGSCLLIEPSGIKIQGASIRINGGGSPSNAELPSLAEMVKPAVLSAIQLATFKKKAPFCEECEKCKGGICVV